MINPHGDDTSLNRLLSYFRSIFFEKIIQIIPFRGHVFLIETDKNTYILKGYSSFKKLKLQETFTATLRKEGFLKTYQFVTPPAEGTLFFDGKYFGCTKYIQPSEKSFSFHSDRNREEGLLVLASFHRVTKKFEARYRSLLPKADLLGKWTERLATFLENIPFLGYFLNRSVLNEMVSWAEWALEGMNQNRSLFEQAPFCILHGDVAHHNFIRNYKGELHLIDFDLISIGPEILDYIQYANRILPDLKWSFNAFAEYKLFQPYLKEKAFLYAIVYPADIFREWNRLIREKTYGDHEKMRQVMELTIGQFDERKKFFQTIKGLVY